MSSISRHTKLDPCCWGEARMQAAYLHIITKAAVSENKSSDETIFGGLSYNSKSRIFRCVAFDYKHKQQRKTRLGTRSENGLFLGSRGNMYRTSILKKKQTIVTTHAEFSNNAFLRSSSVAQFDQKIIEWHADNSPTCSSTFGDERSDVLYHPLTNLDGTTGNVTIEEEHPIKEMTIIP